MILVGGLVMKISKFGLSLIICIAILFGCSDKTIQNKPIYQKSTEVKSLINQSQWEKAQQKGKQIDQLYKDNKWKYQFLGDETEFRGLNKEIIKLQASLEEKDKKEAKRNLSLIEHYIESLYFN